MLDFESIVLIDRDTVSEANLGTRDVRRTGNSWTVFLQATFGPTTESDFVQKQVVVLVACDGNAALQLSRTHHGKIDVLLTDIEMPCMDGISAYLQIKAERPDIKVLFVSGAAKSFLLPEGLAFLPKPFVNLDTLLTKVQELLTEPTPKRAAASR